MADTMNKPKLQVRTSFGVTIGEKSPSPATKLLISHGKPNFTIQKSPKENGNTSPLSPQIENNNNNVNNNNNNNNTSKVDNNYYPYKTISASSPKVFNNNNNVSPVVAAKAKLTEVQTQDNEATKVVLRKTPKVPEPPIKEGEDENVPEFIRRQRRIQERLANQNILDFESRRSGYFTHVMITPTSPNRTSFVETMASPAIVPSLEIPPPSLKEEVNENNETSHEQQNGHAKEVNEALEQTNGYSEEMNGHHVQAAAFAATSHEEEEEVAKAIEEVNKAVEGEDDDKVTFNEHETEVIATAVPASAVLEENDHHVENEEEHVNQHEEVNGSATPVAIATLEHIETHEPQQESENQQVEVQVHQEEKNLNAEVQENGHAHENGNAHAEVKNDEGITISHTNELQNGPHIPAPDPSGALGVNYEPKTVVSFSKDLGSEPNKYPDTVVVTKESETLAPVDPELQTLTKLKFDIKDNENDIEVTPVLKTE